MPEASFRVEMANGVPIVAAPEEIDATNAAGLRTALAGAAAHGNGTVVVDMSQTHFCDSAGLHVLACAHKQAQAEGGELLLVFTAAAVLRVFAVTGIDRMIPHFSTLEEALTHMPTVPGSYSPPATRPQAAAHLEALETSG